MATSTLMQDQAANNAATTDAMALKAENQTYRVYVKLGADGKIIDKETKYGTAGKDNAYWNQLDKDAEAKLALEQTLRIPKVGTLDGFAALLDNDTEEMVNIINRGLMAKINQKISQNLTDLTDDGTNLKFEPVDGAYDIIDWIREPTQRKNLSPLEKNMKQLKTSLKGLFPTLSDTELEAKIQTMFAGLQV
jgi:hypothetical protein